MMGGSCKQEECEDGEEDCCEELSVNAMTEGRISRVFNSQFGRVDR